MTRNGLHSGCLRAPANEDIGRHCGVTLVGRSKHDRLLIFHGGERIAFDR